jgi:hypothetical protein
MGSPRARAALATATAILFAGCATIGQIDLSDERCAGDFRTQIASILVEQGETPDVAAELGQRAVEDVGFGEAGQRPFVVGSRTTDYTFFVQKKKRGCLLRLLSRRRGFSRYTNDITYIASRALTRCRCSAE